jgi:hypothetical protein
MHLPQLGAGEDLLSIVEEAKKQNPFAPKTSSPGSENPTGLEPNDALQSLTT